MNTSNLKQRKLKAFQQIRKPTKKKNEKIYKNKY